MSLQWVEDELTALGEHLLRVTKDEDSAKRSAFTAFGGDAGSYPQSALENLRGIVAAEVQVAQRGKQLRIGAEIEYHRGVDPVRAVRPR